MPVFSRTLGEGISEKQKLVKEGRQQKEALVTASQHRQLLNHEKCHQRRLLKSFHLKQFIGGEGERPIDLSVGLFPLPISH